MKFDTLIIGGGLSAILYSYFNNIPLIYVKDCQHIPYPFEYFDTNMDLSWLFVENEKNDYQLFDKTIKTFGTSKLKLYERVMFYASLGGLVPFSNTIYSIGIEENKLRIEFEFKSMNIEFNKLIIFNDEGIRGLPTIDIPDENPKYMVVDWYDVRFGQEHDFGLFELQDDYIKQIFFHPSSRTKGNFGRQKIRKDVVAVTHLMREQLEDFNFSETIIKLRISKLMKEAGIHGKSKGTRNNKPTIYYYPITLEHDHRDIKKISRHSYEKCDTIEFKMDSIEEDLLKEYKNKELNTYSHTLSSKLICGKDTNS